MSVGTFSFIDFQRQLDADLHSLSTESKRRNAEIKQASDKSIEILKRVKNIDELERHPDFVVPFIMACSSGNAKLTTISMQCVQRLSAVTCIPRDKLSKLLDSFINATQLAVEIQLKVLQVVPSLFKTYAKYIYGPLCSKLLLCCSNLLLLSNKSPTVADTASATLLQLIDELFERLSYKWDEDGETNSVLNDNSYDVFVKENELIKVNAYRYDVNRTFAALCSSLDQSKKLKTKPDEDVFLDTNDIPIDYGLEIMESVLKNSKDSFLLHEDLNYLLKTRAVPSILRGISSTKAQPPTIVRSFRSIRALVKPEFITILEVEMEVILSLLIHVISSESNLPMWKKAISLELFVDITSDSNLLQDIYMTYDNFPDKKHIVKNLLHELNQLLSSFDISTYLQESQIIEVTESPLISNELSVAKYQYIQMLDKVNINSVNLTYIIWLALSIICSCSDSLSKEAQEVLTEGNETNTNDLANIMVVFNGIFDDIFVLHKKLLYSNSLDHHLFHLVARSFQKLAHTAGILSVNEKLNQCLELFSVAIVQNVSLQELQNIDSNLPQDTGTTILNVLSETLMTKTESQQTTDSSKRKQLHKRSVDRKHISLLRALISLSISLGSKFEIYSWHHILITWQWISYYFYGPSADFMDNCYTQDIPPPPSLTKSEIASIEGTILNLVSSTKNYSPDSFKNLLNAIIKCSSSSFTERGAGQLSSYKHFFGEKGIPFCIYNRVFFLTQIGEIGAQNCARFASNEAGNESWNLLMSYLVKLIGNRDLSNSSSRLYATRIFTDIIKKTTNFVDDIENLKVKKETFARLEVLVCTSIMNSITLLKGLDMGKNQIYNGVADTEANILLHLLSTLKEALNEFGDYLTHSWLTVFDIINAPFEWINKDEILISKEDSDDSSLITGLSLKHKEMVEVSYDVFKLISDDFLQTLPLNTIRNVIDTLVNFVSQTRNLNISFSSISQFWLIGDYLRIHHNSYSKAKISDMSLTIQENYVTENASSNEISDGVWLYLLKRLVECTKDKRAEIKNGTIQTFYRIIASYSTSLPDWDLIFSEVLKPLLTTDIDEKEMVESIEFLDSTLQGLINLYPIHFRDFSETGRAKEQWSTLLQFFEKLLSENSSEVAYSAIASFQNLLKEMTKLDNIPKDHLIMTYKIWCGYSIIYGDISGSKAYNQKSGYDCIDELVKGFPHLYALLKSYDCIDVKFVEKSISLFNSAVRYPLLPEHTRDSKKPSSLQKSIMEGLFSFEAIQQPDIEKMILLQLSTIITLPFETREKIEKKLAPKLSSSSRSRIPTFEAVSYTACLELDNRLSTIIEKKPELLEERFITKVIRNLGEVITKKSMIDITSEETHPMWLLASNCLRKLSIQFFQSTEAKTEQSEHLKIVCDIYSKVAVAPLHRVDPKTDEETQEIDIEEYSKYRDVLLRPDVIKFMSEEQLNFSVSVVWDHSFMYQLDEIEDVLVKSGTTLYEVSLKLSEFQFSDIAGSTMEPPLLSKYRCSILCLNDLIKFMTLPGPEYKLLRNVVTPYFVSRVAFALRRYISDQSLVGRAPIFKIRKVELKILLCGLCDILNLFLTGSDISSENAVKNLQLLYPLILRTIPISHKVSELQNIVLELLLGFTKLTSK